MLVIQNRQDASEHIAECLSRYKAGAKRRRSDAIAYLDGMLHEDMFEHRWQWLDILGEAAKIQRERDDSISRAISDRAKHDAKLAAREAIHAG